MGYLIRFEVHQIKELKWEYLSIPWNWLDIISFAMNIIVHILCAAMILEDGDSSLDLEQVRATAAITSCFILVKIFDWLRLFEDTAFYVKLLVNTFEEIGYFLSLIILAMISFGVPLIILSLNSAEDERIVENLFDFWIVDMVISQYMLLIGGFEVENFKDNPYSFMCYVFFGLATFIAQIMMINMLIAIMTDSYEKVMENKSVNGIKTKLELLSDLAIAKKQRSDST